MTSTVKNEESSHNAPPLQVIRGLKIAVAFDKSIVEEVLDFVPQDDDIIIATYPKTGTTWMSYIVHQILTNGESFPSFKVMLNEAVPFLEKTGLKALENATTKPRVYKHHIPYNFMKKNQKAKVIYVYRKPEDTFVSYFYFLQELYKPKPIDFDQYFEDFLSGNISYGRYFEHILSFLECKHEGNILFVSYEKLLAQTKDEILRVAKFLGEKYYETLVASDNTLLNKIIELTSFKFMKSNLSYLLPVNRNESSDGNQPSTGADSASAAEREVTFFRKGIVGDGKVCLTPDQLSRLIELAKETMEGTEVLSEWMQG